MIKIKVKRTLYRKEEIIEEKKVPDITLEEATGYQVENGHIVLIDRQFVFRISKNEAYNPDDIELWIGGIWVTGLEFVEKYIPYPKPDPSKRNYIENFFKDHSVAKLINKEPTKILKTKEEEYTQSLFGKEEEKAKELFDIEL